MIVLVVGFFVGRRVVGIFDGSINGLYVPKVIKSIRFTVDGNIVTLFNVLDGFQLIENIFYDFTTIAHRICDGGLCLFIGAIDCILQLENA